MSKSRKASRSRQQIKDEQINYLLGDVEKNFEEYRNALELKKYYFWQNKATIKLLLKTKTLRHI